MVTNNTLSLKLFPYQSSGFIIKKQLFVALFVLCSLMALFIDLETTGLGALVYYCFSFQHCHSKSKSE